MSDRTPEQLDALKGGVTLRRERDEARAELKLLRAIIGDRLEEHGITTKPEDVADVVRWAKHPDAVRELLSHTPVVLDVGLESTNCASCNFDSETHGNAALRYRGSEVIEREHCAVAAAWRALGDPRGAEDIERAHEEALRLDAAVAAFDELHTPGGLFDERGLRIVRGRAVGRHDNREVRIEDVRATSDARGMEAVEADARAVEQWRMDVIRAERPDLVDAH